MGTLITFLIGHRGAGKTSYLQGLARYIARHKLDVKTYDLDEEIAKRGGIPIAELFARGEKRFRELERGVCEDIVRYAKGPTVIALGAGFDGAKALGSRAIWIRRTTDSSGRVFLNRPRLNLAVSPYEEFLERLPARDARYREWADEELFLPEGYTEGLESFAFSPPGWNLPFDLTLSSKNAEDWNEFWSKRLYWGLRRLELRDDLLSRGQIETVLESVPREQVLYSVRRPGAVCPEDCDFDWPMELGPAPQRAFSISLHERQGSVEESLAGLSREGGRTGGNAILKAAIEIASFAELKAGHDWWLQDPDRRAFLPRSKDGRWRWYRSLFGRQMPIHFFREDEGSAPDQPYLWQELLQPDLQSGFAAVLGQPVEHSRSPLEHLEFFREIHMPFVAIGVHEAEFSQAFTVLRGLGLVAAAVTAPLKKLAFEASTERTPEAQSTGAANTLYVQGEYVHAHNTDLLALKEIAANLDSKPGKIWLWGGGGVKTSVKATWPEIEEISAREGTDREDSPEILIWATGRSRSFKFPNLKIRPGLVLDLNYSEDSPGLEWAVRERLNYRSGLEMFRLQAEAQRRFWREKIII